MDVVESEICIYCRQPGYSREHNPPASLGGNCVLSCVCTQCNKTLSAIDQGLAENSPVAVSKAAFTPPAAFCTHVGGEASTVDQFGLTLGVRVGNEMKTHVRPQFFLDGNSLKARTADRDGISELIAHIDKQISEGKLADTYIEVNAEFRVPRFLMHRSTESYVSASSIEDAEHLLRVLQAQWPDIRNNLLTCEEVKVETRQPSVLMKLTMRPNDEFRGVAKIAFEAAALLCGPQFVLRPTFDPIREYIMGDVRLPPIDPANPEALAIDARFVRRIVDCPVKFTDQHGVLLIAGAAGILGLVILYGEHCYSVTLAPRQDGEPWMRCYEFSYTKDGHHEIDQLDFARRALERFPEQLKIAKENIPYLLNIIQKNKAGR